MRAISPHANYSIQLVAAKVRRGVDPTGEIIEVTEREPVLAQFEHFAITPEEEAAALKAFNFSGLPEGVNPLTTLGVFDTDIFATSRGLDEEQKKSIEDLLRKKGEEQGWVRYIICEAPKAPKPWATYDEDTAEEVVQIAKRLKMESAALAYEEDNEKRPAVLEALGTSEEAAIEVAV